MERISSKTVYEGPIATVRIDGFRYADGSTAERQVVAHPGAVAVVAHDAEHLYLVRQPREAVGEERLLELPAGKLDVEGESPLECARRELVEEIGRAASEWRELKRFYTSPGFAEEEVTRLPGHRARAGRARARPRGADRDRRLAAGRARARDRGVRRLEVADRDAAAAPSCCGSALAPAGARPWSREPARMAVAVREPEERAHRRPLRGAGARLPRLPGVRARTGAQHARRLPHRPAAVRRLPRRAASATRPRPSAPTSPTSSPISRPASPPDAEGDGGRAPLLAGDDQPQDRLPALLLPPPAPRGADRRRPDRDPEPAAEEPQAAAGAQPRPR